MSNSYSCLEVPFDLSADDMPGALRDAVEESGMTPEVFMDAAENIQSVATLLGSCVDLYSLLLGVLDSLLSLVVAVLLVLVPTFLPLMLCVEAIGVSFTLQRPFPEDVLGALLMGVYLLPSSSKKSFKGYSPFFSAWYGEVIK